jgi:pimeloyl-ACP methyl ester carboxylesterase
VRAAIPADELVEIGDQTVHVVNRGAGEPVVFLHGFGASGWSWRGVTEELGPGFRTVAIDLSGFGWTERPRDPDRYTREAQIALVLGVADALGLDRFHLVGHSYGGSLAQTLGAQHPERLRSLVLVNAARPAYAEDRRTPLASLLPLDVLFLRTFGLRPAAVRRALEASMVDDSLVTPELVRGYRDRLTVEGTGRAYWGLTRPRPDRLGSLAPVDLAEISAPTLVVWGAEDELISVDDARERAAQIPNSRFVVLDGVGHLPPEEAPARLATELQQFLTSLDDR